jgi:hypothetical protein
MFKISNFPKDIFYNFVNLQRNFLFLNKGKKYFIGYCLNNNDTNNKLKFYFYNNKNKKFITIKMQSQNELNNDNNNFENKILSTRIGDITYLNSENSKKVDDILMGENYKYSIDQLMEIAGLSVAKCIDNYLQEENKSKNKNKILLICGPGSKYINYMIKKHKINNYFL